MLYINHSGNVYRKSIFSIAYHKNFHLPKLSSLTLMFYLIENVGERKKGNLMQSKMNFKHFTFADTVHIPII